MKRTTPARTATAATAAACLMALAIHSLVRPLAAAAAAKPAANNVLLESMDAELHRAMTSLGGSDPAQPKPYFLSYAVSDADSIAISAQYGAIISNTSSRRRMADVQVRLGSAAQDNTHETIATPPSPPSLSPLPTIVPLSAAVSGSPLTAATVAPSIASSRSRPSSRSALKKRTSPATSPSRPTSPTAPTPSSRPHPPSL